MKNIASALVTFAVLFAAASSSSANTFYSVAPNYAESKTVTTCGTINTCSVIFHKVGTNKTLLITHVSCRIVAKSTVAPLTRAVLTDNSGQARESLTPLLLATDGENVQHFQLNNEASAVFLGSVAATATPQVSVTFDGSIEIKELSCSVAGQYL